MAAESLFGGELARCLIKGQQVSRTATKMFKGGGSDFQLDRTSGALRCERLRSYADWQRLDRDSVLEWQERREYETSLIQAGEFAVEGTCWPCGSRAAFAVDYRYAYANEGRVIPNWREQLSCPRCGLNNRMRASVHLLDLLLDARPTDRILIAEEMTPVYSWLSRNCGGLEGFEFLGNEVPFGQRNPRRIRNETFTALTFGGGTFDHVLSFDVFEHIADYRRAFDECFRVLRPGGNLLFSVPFLIDRPANLVRARYKADGQLHHFEPPEYHGDPLNVKGCLAFYHFGWQLLDEVRAAGFSDAAAYLYWSKEFCYLGANQIIFVATK